MKTNSKNRFNQVYSRFLRLKNKYDRQVSSGKFELLSSIEQSKIIKGLHKAIQQLAGLKLHMGKTATLAAFTGLMSIGANAQNFIEVTGTANPLNSLYGCGNVHPVFVDIDNDGDQDLFYNYWNVLTFKENTGTSATPAFSNTPWVTVANVGSNSNINSEFVDLDDDGDFDLIVSDGPQYFWEHENDATTPIQSAFSTSSVATTSLGSHCGNGQPAFADLDNDGDQDFVYGGTGTSGIEININTGTPTAATWGTPTTLITSTDTWTGSPDLYDFDNDGDFDLIIGKADGTIEYYENQGTASTHNFVQQTGTDNPFNSIDVGDYAYPVLVNLDNDIIPELVVGNQTSNLKYYDNQCTGSDATTQVENSCSPFEWIDGITYTSSNNTATHTLLNSTGCDSVVTLNFTINSPNITTSVTNNIITANNTTASSYQWIDVDNANAPISGETGISFTATENGNYAVIVTENGCTDTSATVNIAGLGLVGINAVNVQIYPNPNHGEFTISTTEKDLSYTVYGIEGKVIIDDLKLTTQNQLINLTGLDKGMYFVKVSNDKREKIIRLVIE